MEDLQQNNTKIQILYSFVTNFEAITKTVKEMVLSGEAGDYMRAESICDIVGGFVYDVQRVEVFIDRIDSVAVEERLKPMVAALKEDVMKQRDSIMMQLATRHQMLLDILILRTTIRPKEVRKAEKAAEQAIFDALSDDEKAAFNRKVVLKKGIPIEGKDLQILNEIAMANVSKNRLVSDYAKKFKVPEVRDTIRRLYHQAPYYFEQAFSNTDVNVQFVLLEIIRDDYKRDSKNQEKIEAFDALNDLHVLSTIDTTANKMTSKVSDHQAFELFLSTLAKPNNDYIVWKLINDDVILNTLFDISTRDLESYYGFRRMFTVARYPFDSMIVEKYKRLKKINPDMFKAIVRDLSKDDAFRLSWENYMKTERTKDFMKSLEQMREGLTRKELTHDELYGLIFALQQFSTPELYNQDILTYDFMATVLEEVYYFIIRNNLYDKYSEIDIELRRYLGHRIDCALNATRLKYKNYGGEATFAVTVHDLWYDIHRMMHRYGFSGEWFYLRFDEETCYRFQYGQPVVLHEGRMSARDVKALTTKEYYIDCSNRDGRGFDQYIFNLYGRIVKAFMADKVSTKLRELKTARFRKVEIPGLSVRDDQRLKKGIFEFMTLLFLWEKDSELFLHVYRRRIDGLMRALGTMEMPMDVARDYIRVTSNDWVLNIFNYKSFIKRLRSEWEMLSKSDNLALTKEHAKRFFELAERSWSESYKDDTEL